MPIFNDNITFIHIPKCGGTSIETFLVNNGYKMSLFTSTGSVFINGHTPQHCTYQELNELNLLTDKIFTIVRPEIDRVVSEYFYILDRRPDLKMLFNNFEEFLDLFLNKSNYLLFDYHNVPNKEFLIDKNNIINPKIKIFNFLEFDKIENFLGLKGLNNIHKMKSNKYDILNSDHLLKINNFYKQN